MLPMSILVIGAILVIVGVISFVKLIRENARKKNEE